MRLVLVFITVAAVTLATVYVSTNYLQSSAKKLHSACSRPGVRYVMTIKNAVVTPEHINAKRCDSLVITNEDKSERLIAFGEHDHHVAYAGITTEALTKGHSLTVQLTQIGMYRFNDHFQDSVSGTFTVAR